MGLEEQRSDAPPHGAGTRLANAREAAGLSRADVAGTTKIAERMLLAIEQGNYSVLPSRTYAIGFARAYARAVGLDAEAVVRQVRTELDGRGPPPEPASEFEPGDPARVPNRRLAWAAVAAIVLVLGGLGLWRRANEPVSGLPSILPPDAPATHAPAPLPPAASPTPAPDGPVAITARETAWILLSDGGRTLVDRDLKPGESITVPANASDPRLRTGRPDALTLTIGGRPVPPLADRQTVIVNAPVSAAALRARPAPATMPATNGATAATTTGTTSTTATPAAAGSPAVAPPGARPHPTRRQAGGVAPSAAPASAAPSSAVPLPSANPSTATP